MSERQEKKEILTDLYKGKIKLQDIKDNNIDMYVLAPDQFETIDRLRCRDRNKTPKGRINLLISGTGGAGKTTLSYELAKLITDSIFTFKDIEAGFLNYSDQKAIIGNEIRSGKLGEGGMPRFFCATDTGEYDEGFINVKYGAVKLCQKLNIMNTSQEGKNFLTSLCDRHKEGDDIENKYILTQPENMDQVNRREPVILNLTKEVIQENEYKTIIKCFKGNEKKENNFNGEHYDEIFYLEIPTTRKNFKQKLIQFAKGFKQFMDGDTYGGNFQDLSKYIDKTLDTNNTTEDNLVRLNQIKGETIEKYEE